MTAKKSVWDRLASELEQRSFENLGGVTARRPRAVRTRGSVGVRRSVAPSLERRSIVVVEVSETEAVPSEERLRKKLQVRQGDLDFYYVMYGRHWVALGPRELNPHDPEFGGEHELILKNLKPDYAIVCSRETPSWCGPKTRVVRW
jgi:hypothetical protein